MQLYRILKHKSSYIILRREKPNMNVRNEETNVRT